MRYSEITEKKKKRKSSRWGGYWGFFGSTGSTSDAAAGAGDGGGGESVREEEVNINNKSGGVSNNSSIIDNKNGWGAVPNNQEVDYFGLRVTMTPKHFIDLAAPLGGEPSEKIAQHLEQGGTIGSPFLSIEIPESWENGDFSMPARVVGHEGRNRMAAIAKVFGNNPVETHLFFPGLRNRHITDEFKKNLNRGLVKEKSKSIVQGPFFNLTESIRENAQSQPIVYLDMDGVLADFFTEYARLAGIENGNYRDIPPAKTDPTLQKMIGTDFFARLPKFATADQLVNMVVRVFGYYNICSSPLRGDHANSEKQKQVWIQKHLSPAPREIIITPRKSKYAVQADGTPNILIDDRGNNITEWENAGGVGIKYQADEDTLAVVTAGLKRAMQIVKKEREHQPQQLKSLDRNLPVAVSKDAPKANDINTQ